MKTNMPPELQGEFLAWEQMSDEVWAMIDQWEMEEQFDLSDHE